jgi:hypothetical protein
MSGEEKQTWQDRYEKLRQQALEPNHTVAMDRWGLILLVRKGIAGWMRAWGDSIDCSDLPTEGEFTSINLPRLWQEEATVLLANMALSHCCI